MGFLLSDAILHLFLWNINRYLTVVLTSFPELSSIPSAQPEQARSRDDRRDELSHSADLLAKVPETKRRTRVCANCREAAAYWLGPRTARAPRIPLCENCSRALALAMVREWRRLLSCQRCHGDGFVPDAVTAGVVIGRIEGEQAVTVLRITACSCRG